MNQNPRVREWCLESEYIKGTQGLRYTGKGKNPAAYPQKWVRYSVHIALFIQRKYMLLINILINSYKAIVNQVDGKHKMKVSKKNQIVCLELWANLTWFKREPKFSLKFQISTIVARREYISWPTHIKSPFWLSTCINMKTKGLKNG